MSMPEVRRILLYAAELIEERGWCQNATQDEQGRLCALGALSESTDFDDQFVFAMDALIDHIGTDDIPAYNDAPGRTKAEVVSAMRRAAGES